MFTPLERHVMIAGITVGVLTVIVLSMIRWGVNRIMERIYRNARTEIDEIKGVSKMPKLTPPWAGWLWLFNERCLAVKEPNASGYHGRCELISNHRGWDHHLERGMHHPTWSTEWTNNDSTPISPPAGRG